MYRLPFGLSLSKPFDKLNPNGSYFIGPDPYKTTMARPASGIAMWL
jgi:hypothetical protein